MRPGGEDEGRPQKAPFEQTTCYAPLTMRILAPLLLAVLIAGCGESRPPLNELSRFDFAMAYAEAWSSQDPEELAAFYSEDGELIVNNGEPAIGRDGVEAKAASFMEAFRIWK